MLVESVVVESVFPGQIVDYVPGRSTCLALLTLAVKDQ